MPMGHRSLKVRIGYVFDGTDFWTKIGTKLIIVGHLDYQNYAHLVLTQRNPDSRFSPSTFAGVIRLKFP